MNVFKFTVLFSSGQVSKTSVNLEFHTFKICTDSKWKERKKFKRGERKKK